MKFKNESILQTGFSKELDYIALDKDNLKNNLFKWEDIELPTINERHQFINIFVNRFKDKEKNKEKKETLAHKIENSFSPLHCFLNIQPLYEIFTLRYINDIVEHPSSNYGQPIYNNSLSFYTQILDFFNQFYIEKDFRILDKIVARDIETIDPISRIKIRKKNSNNEFIKKKYFSEEFNVLKFCLKIITNFLPGATWRWIGGHHKAHVHSLRLCKLLLEYGVLNNDEIEELRHVLYLKVQVLRSLETIIDNDHKKKSIGQEWFDIWVEGLKFCRGFFFFIYF